MPQPKKEEEEKKEKSREYRKQAIYSLSFFPPSSWVHIANKLQGFPFASKPSGPTPRPKGKGGEGEGAYTDKQTIVRSPVGDLANIRFTRGRLVIQKLIISSCLGKSISLLPLLTPYSLRFYG